MNVAAEPTSDFYTLAALAAAWGMSRPGLRRMAARGEVPGARRIGSRWIFLRSEVLAAFAAPPSGRPSSSSPPPRSVPSTSHPRPLQHSDLQRMWTSGNIRDAKGGGR